MDAFIYVNVCVSKKCYLPFCLVIGLAWEYLDIFNTGFLSTCSTMVLVLLYKF